jgi:hypothetical protein
VKEAAIDQGHLFMACRNSPRFPQTNIRLTETLVKSIGEGWSEMTPEEDPIKRYSDAFNRDDLEGVMACFHSHPVIVGRTHPANAHRVLTSLHQLIQETDGELRVRKFGGVYPVASVQIVLV